jgi:hypothetical protein
MSTKKLSALLTSVDENEVIEIQAIIDERNQASSTEPELTEAQIDANEEAFLAELAKNETPEAKVANALKVNKMTYEECVELAKSLEININHRCRVVPFNTIEWADATIAGVIADKRSNKVLYAIKCDDGRRIVKAHDSKMLTILDETSEITAKRSRSTSTVEKLDDYKLMILANELSIHVGRICTFKPTKDIFIVRESDQAIIDADKLEGVIMAIVPDKRSGRILYRIKSVFNAYDELGDDTNGPATKVEEIIVHKVSTAADVIISDIYDEDVRTKFIQRNEANEMKKLLSPADFLESARKALEKAKSDVEKVNKTMDLRIAEFEKAQEAFNQSVTQSVETEEGEELS